jgi:hypothetical protein
VTIGDASSLDRLTGGAQSVAGSRRRAERSNRSADCKFDANREVRVVIRCCSHRGIIPIINRFTGGSDQAGIRAT